MEVSLDRAYFTRHWLLIDFLFNIDEILDNIGDVEEQDLKARKS
jgi:hypothetical protein